MPLKGEVVVSSPKGSSQLEVTYRGMTITGGTFLDATLLFTPTAQSPRLNRGNVRVVSNSGDLQIVTLFWGGGDSADYIQHAIPPGSKGLITIANNLPIRVPAGDVTIACTTPNVASVFAEFWEEG